MSITHWRDRPRPIVDNRRKDALADALERVATWIGTRIGIRYPILAIYRSSCSLAASFLAEDCRFMLTRTFGR